MKHFTIFEGETVDQAGERINRYNEAERIVQSSGVEVEAESDRPHLPEGTLRVTFALSANNTSAVNMNPIQALALLELLKMEEATLRAQANALAAKTDAAYIENGYEDGAWA